MRAKLFTVLFCLFFTISANASEDIQSALFDIETYFTSIEGVVVGIESKDRLLVDIGSDKKAVAGLKLCVLKGEVDIIHPVTGKVLGKRENVMGDIYLTKIHSEYSEASYTGAAPAAGDKVRIMMPMPISIATENLTEEDNETVASILAVERVFKKSDKPDYNIILKRTESVVSYQVQNTGGVVLLAGVVKSAKAYPYTFETMYRRPLASSGYISIAGGKVYKDKPKTYLVGLQGNNVRILDPEYNFAVAGTIDIKNPTLISVDVADVDGDGQDEIFVSNLLKDRDIRSVILKHDGKEFVEVASELPWVFRSVRDKDGKRSILIQKVDKEGGYSGEIFHLVYKNGVYGEGDALKGTLGKELLGFGLIPEAFDDSDLYINIDRGSRMSLSTYKKTEYNAPGYFGDTFNKFAIISVKKTNNDTDMATDYMKRVMYSRPHIEVLDNKYFIVVKNDLKTRMLANTQLFDKSSLNMFYYEYGLMRTSAYIGRLDPVIVDIWYENKGGEHLLYALVSENGWLLSSGESAIVVYRVKKTD